MSRQWLTIKDSSHLFSSPHPATGGTDLTYQRSSGSSHTVYEMKDKRDLAFTLVVKMQLYHCFFKSKVIKSHFDTTTIWMKYEKQYKQIR